MRTGRGLIRVWRVRWWGSLVVRAPWVYACRIAVHNVPKEQVQSSQQIIYKLSIISKTKK